MQKTVPTFTTAQPVEDRALTYRLRSGGILVDECPTWCILDHADDITKLVNAEDLIHEGEEISLRAVTVEGNVDGVLAARIQQWPYSTSGDGSEVPYMAYRVNADYGEAMGYSTPEEVEVEIRRTEAHLSALRGLNQRLAAARAEDTSRADTGPLTVGDIQTMPVPVLLRAFGLAVVEVGEMPDRTQGFLDMTGPRPRVYLLRSLAQADREGVVRQLLAPVVEARR